MQVEDTEPGSLFQSSQKCGDGPQAKACGSDGADEAQTEPWALEGVAKGGGPRFLV